MRQDNTTQTYVRNKSPLWLAPTTWSPNTITPQTGPFSSYHSDQHWSDISYSHLEYYCLFRWLYQLKSYSSSVKQAHCHYMKRTSCLVPFQMLFMLARGGRGLPDSENDCTPFAVKESEPSIPRCCGRPHHDVVTLHLRLLTGQLVTLHLQTVVVQSTHTYTCSGIYKHISSLSVCVRVPKCACACVCVCSPVVLCLEELELILDAVAGIRGGELQGLTGLCWRLEPTRIQSLQTHRNTPDLRGEPR